MAILDRVFDKADRAIRLESENRALRRQVDELRQALEAVEPIIDWLGCLRDKGEQVGNLNMELVDKARAALVLSDEDKALARVGGGGGEEEVTK